MEINGTYVYTNVNHNMKMKQRFLFILLIFLLGCNKQEHIEDPKFFYQEYNPPIELNKFEEKEFDLDNNNQNDIKFFIDNNISVGGGTRYGVYVMSISESLELSYGRYVGSADYEFLRKSDEFSNNLDWYKFITICGYVRSNYGWDGKMEYLGLSKTKDNRHLYGWVRLKPISDSTLKIFEYFLSNDSSLHITVGNK